jgi:hypothetical protein
MFDWRMVVGTAAFGLYTAILQTTRSRLQFYRFGLGSTSQSIAFLVLSFVLVRPHPSTSAVLEAFAGSYFIGAIFSAALVQARLAKPSWKMLKEYLTIGTAPTLSSVAAMTFQLACRYVLIAMGSVAALGTFSFSLDLAEKTVGVFISIATFGIVPHALKSRNVHHLWRSLARGSLAAVFISLMSAGAILVLGLTSWVSALNGALYDPLSFVLVSAGVMMNRAGKMILTPVVMRLRQTQLQLLPMLIVSPLGLLFVWLGTLIRLPYVIELAYLIALSAWSVWGYLLVLPKVRRLISATARPDKGALSATSE